MATLDTYATEGDLPTGANGDMAYVTATDRIYLNDAGTWRYWNYDAVAGVDANDLAYTGARTGNPTSGTNYVITTQPDCHYDASKYVELSSSGAALGDAVDLWGDRSGNANNATQTGGTDQPTYVKNHGNFGLQWPDSTSLGFLDTNYTPGTDPPGHTLVLVANIPNTAFYTGMLTNSGQSSFYSPGLSLNTTLDPTGTSIGGSLFYASGITNVASQYTRIYAILDVIGDQKMFQNLAETYSGSASHSQAQINSRLDDVYWIGKNGYTTMGDTAADGHGGIIYEALIFQSSLSYTSDGTNLTGGNLKIVVDYLMNKYRISTDLIS
jgi:hypothetical protein